MAKIAATYRTINQAMKKETPLKNTQAAHISNTLRLAVN
jgi:hypothetical protein